nr:hypothetical protein [Tanacetum cinerariifolium]
MNVSFDELSVMAFKQRSSKPGLQCMTSGQISSGLDLTYAPSIITKQQPTEGELDLLFEAMYDDYSGGQPSATVENVPPVQEPQVRQTSMASITIADNVPIPTNSSSHAKNIPITSQDVDELNQNAMVDEFGDSYKAPPEETAKDKGLAGEVYASTKKKGRTVAITAEDMQKRKNDDISQIDDDDIEEMDTKWNLALLCMRADRFWKKTGKKITIQRSDVAGFDKSKVECFNCHKMGHFTRECRSPRCQDRGKKEIYKKDPKVEELAPKAMIAIDGIGWD